MGKVGRALGAALGKGIGHFAGKNLGKYTGMYEKEGSKRGEQIGAGLGELLPFKKGGRIPRTMPILAHKGEYILPRGVKPTAKQRKQIAKKARKMKRR